jgi:hypothetical protein
VWSPESAWPWDFSAKRPSQVESVFLSLAPFPSSFAVCGSTVLMNSVYRTISAADHASCIRDRKYCEDDNIDFKILTKLRFGSHECNIMSFGKPSQGLTSGTLS